MVNECPFIQTNPSEHTSKLQKSTLYSSLRTPHHTIPSQHPPAHFRPNKQYPQQQSATKTTKGSEEHGPYMSYCHYHEDHCTSSDRITNANNTRERASARSKSPKKLEVGREMGGGELRRWCIDRSWPALDLISVFDKMIMMDCALRNSMIKLDWEPVSYQQAGDC